MTKTIKISSSQSIATLAKTMAEHGHLKAVKEAVSKALEVKAAQKLAFFDDVAEAMKTSEGLETLMNKGWEDMSRTDVAKFEKSVKLAEPKAKAKTAAKAKPKAKVEAANDDKTEALAAIAEGMKSIAAFCNSMAD